jgi:TetR/AcrR family tetracycline transcriptional repressor
MALKILKREKRKVGRRAGLDRSKILTAAMAVWLSEGQEGFNMREVATRLGVVPTTIYAHFKDTAELIEELARKGLDELTVPYKANQKPEDYLREFFRSTLVGCLQHPHLGDLLSIALREHPLFSPIFAERLCETLAGIEKNQPLDRKLQMVLTRLVGMIAMETAGWTLDPERAKAKISERVAELAGKEFSTLRLVGEKLGVGPGRRTAPDYVGKTSSSIASALLSELKAKSK